MTTDLRLLDKTQTVTALSDLVDNAQKTIFLVCPYVRMSRIRDLKRRLESALQRKVPVSIAMRAPDQSTHKPDEADAVALQELCDLGMRLFIVPDLHAKFYLSESAALISSLNLTDASFSSSIELGVWIPSSRTEYAEAKRLLTKEIRPHLKPVEETDFLDAKPHGRSKTQNNHPKSKPESWFFDEDEIQLDDEGFCIRCRGEIDLDPDRPYCTDDYRDWAKYKKREYVDSFCHGCGKKYPATMEKPLCDRCYRDSQPF